MFEKNGHDKPKEQFTTTKTKTSFLVKVSVGLIVLTLLFSGSMFLLAGSISMSKYINTSRTRPSSSSGSVVSGDSIYKPPSLECGTIRKIVKVPSSTTPTIESAIATYGAPLDIRVVSSILTRVNISDWNAPDYCPNIIEKDPAITKEIKIKGLKVEDSSNLIVRNLTFEDNVSDLSAGLVAGGSSDGTAIVYLKSYELSVAGNTKLKNIEFSNNIVRSDDYGKVCSLKDSFLSSDGNVNGLIVSNGKNIKINNNDFQSCFKKAIWARGTRDSEISHNHIGGIFYQGIWVSNNVWQRIYQDVDHYSNINTHNNRIESRINVQYPINYTCQYAGMGMDGSHESAGVAFINKFNNNDVAMNDEYLASSLTKCSLLGVNGPNSFVLVDTLKSLLEIKNNNFFNSKQALNSNGSVSTLTGVINNSYNTLYNCSGVSCYAGAFVAGLGDLLNNPNYRLLGTGTAPFDFHLLSTSPSIDSGNSLDEYKNEPNPNGCKINRGSYGNTAEATSLSTAIHCP
ncbi:MAG: hypothetical protein PHS07_03725 [Patescibacteria group bacterium]|jgi:hypothetical protein|nr:hypothetical protein [Patescibacteria group bacterium]